MTAIKSNTCDNANHSPGIIYYVIKSDIVNDRAGRKWKNMTAISDCLFCKY